MATQNSPIMIQENPAENIVQEYVERDVENMQSNKPSPNQPTVAEPEEKSKRVRTKYNSQQLLALEEAFCLENKLRRSKRILLAMKLELTERQVKIWFQNRRMKFRKESNPEQGESEPKVKNDSTPPLKKPIFNNKLVAAMPQNINLPKNTNELKEYRNGLNRPNQFHTSSNSVQFVGEFQGYNWQQFHQQPQHQLYPQTQEFQVQYCPTQNSYLPQLHELQPQVQCNTIFNAKNKFNQDYNSYMSNLLLKQYSVQYSVE